MEVKKFERQYSELLLDPNYIKLELLYQRPNIFTALRLANHEIRHSNFLAWLLNPKGTHGLGSKFLTLVLSDILLDERAANISVTSIGNLNLDNAVILREWKNIDILIKVDDLIITIENKIWATESQHQLGKYENLIDQEYTTKSKVYVFLTPFGDESSMSHKYVNYSYGRILWILQLIMTSYADRISSSVLVYLADYVETLKLTFMGNGEINTLARQVYLNHKELFDFILNHTPNPINELQDYFSKKLKKYGWVKKTSERNYVRFLTRKLVGIIPNNSTSWKGEAFLFEFWIKAEEVAFYFTIAPGDVSTRNILQKALKDFNVLDEGDLGFGYICYGWTHKELANVETFSHDITSLDSYLQQFWTQVEEIVANAEKAILANQESIAAIPYE